MLLYWTDYHGTTLLLKTIPQHILNKLIRMNNFNQISINKVHTVISMLFALCLEHSLLQICSQEKVESLLQEQLPYRYYLRDRKMDWKEPSMLEMWEIAEQYLLLLNLQMM